MAQSSNTTVGLIGYAELDPTDNVEDRALFVYPAFKSTAEIEQKLHDVRTSDDIAKGPEGLDEHGFTYVHHPLPLNQDQLCDGTNLEDIYVPEIERLVLSVTGAKRAIVDNVAIRRGLPATSHDHLFQKTPRGSEIDANFAKLPRNDYRVFGKEKVAKIAPYRFAHVDYTTHGLQQTVRWGRKEVAEMAGSALAAEDAGKVSRLTNTYKRPLEIVKRDPLAVLDWRTLDTADMVPFTCRALSGVDPEGEFLRETGMGALPKEPSSQRWYWMPYQTPDDVLIVKFADTGTLQDSRIAAHCLHCSPGIEGTSENEARVSVECRVFAFWD